MSSSVKGKIDRAYDEMQETHERQQTKNTPLITDGILEFCRDWLDFKPYSYQEKLLLDPAQFIVARWCRQSGKSHTITAKLLHSALSHPRWRAVLLAPSLRQSKKNISKISSFAQKIVDK